MRHESLRLVIEAARINPAATVRSVATGNDRYAEALVDVYAHGATGGASTWTSESWESLLEAIDQDPRTLAQYVDSVEVRALIRAQEATSAAP